MNYRYLGGFLRKSVSIVAFLALLICLGGILLAQDVNSLAKDANSQLREAQNKMFSGKHQEAMDILVEVSAILEKIKAADPENSNLKTLESKYEKLKKDIERRLPKEDAPPAEEKKEASEDQKAELAALAKEADKEFGSAQRNFFSSKYDEANAQLLKVSELINKITAIDSEYSKLATLNSKYNKLISDIEKRTGKTSEAKPVQTAASKADSDKLPSAVTKRLKDIRSNITAAERYFRGMDTVAREESNLKNSQYSLSTIESIMEEIRKGYGDKIPDGNPEMKAIQDEIDAFKGRIDEYAKKLEARKSGEAQAKDQMESMSQEWIDKFAPYATGLGQPGYNPDKYFISSATANAEEMKQRKAIYDELLPLFEEYKKVQFPAGKTYKLEVIEEQLERDLKEFPGYYKESVGYVLKWPKEQLDQKLAYLDRDKKWVSDVKEKPPIVSLKDIEEIREKINEIAKSMPADDPKIAELNKKLADLEKKNNELWAVRTERTFLTPDKFTGKELKILLGKAEEIVLGDFPKAKVLRKTIISEDWKEERVLEFTDTTKTATRYRITQSLTGQVAAKNGADVFLYTVHIAKDKKSDGSWGALYGHIMFTDPMLEKNVNKDAPK